MVMMKVRFMLVMRDLWVKDKDLHLRPIDLFSISWESELSREQILRISEQWVSEKYFLTNWMSGLKKVGEASLEIEPIREED